MTPTNLTTLQAIAAYEMASEVFKLGNQRLVCNGYTHKCQAQDEQIRSPSLHDLWPGIPSLGKRAT